jgi:hypothetical protein
MLNITIPTREVVTHSILPRVEQVVERIIHDIGAEDLFENNINYTGDFTTSPYSTNNKNEPMLNTNRIDCAIESNLLHPFKQKDNPTKPGSEIYTPYISATHFYRPPIFDDPNTLTALTNHEMPLSLSLGLTLNIVDRVVAYDIYTRLVNIYTNGDMMFDIDLLDTIPIPEEIYTVLYMVHNLSGGSWDGFLPWLTENSNGLISGDLHRINNNIGELVIRNILRKVLVRLEISDAAPKGVKDQKTNRSFQINLSCNFTCDRSDSLILQYPITINNQHIPEYAIYVDPTESYNNTYPLHKYLHYTEYNKSIRGNSTLSECVKLPWYDQWKLPSIFPSDYKPFFTAVITLDNVNDAEATTDIDLTKSLNGFLLDLDILDILELQGSRSMYPQDFLYVAMMVDNDIMDPSGWSFNGKIVSITRKDIAPTYRLILSEYKKPGFVYKAERQSYVGYYIDADDNISTTRLIVYPDGNIVETVVKYDENDIPYLVRYVINDNGDRMLDETIVEPSVFKFDYYNGNYVIMTNTGVPVVTEYTDHITVPLRNIKSVEKIIGANGQIHKKMAYGIKYDNNQTFRAGIFNILTSKSR